LVPPARLGSVLSSVSGPSAPVPTLARTFARGATALALSPAAAARSPFNRVAARCRCATSARPWPPQGSTRDGLRMRHSASESLPTGSRPAAVTRPPHVRVAARWRYMVQAQRPLDSERVQRSMISHITAGACVTRLPSSESPLPGSGPQPLRGLLASGSRPAGATWSKRSVRWILSEYSDS
jgi:hypothetical protein